MTISLVRIILFLTEKICKCDIFQARNVLFPEACQRVSGLVKRRSCPSLELLSWMRVPRPTQVKHWCVHDMTLLFIGVDVMIYCLVLYMFMITLFPKKGKEKGRWWGRWPLISVTVKQSMGIKKPKGTKKDVSLLGKELSNPRTIFHHPQLFNVALSVSLAMLPQRRHL